MAVGTLSVGVPVRLTSSGNVAGAGTALAGAQAESATSGQATILGFFVASSTTGNIKLTNIAAGGGAGSTVLVNTTATLAVGWYPLPLTVASGGIYCTITNTLDVTFIVAE
jgi:hypothetical protein